MVGAGLVSGAIYFYRSLDHSGGTYVCAISNLPFTADFNGTVPDNAVCYESTDSETVIVPCYSVIHNSFKPCAASWRFLRYEPFTIFSGFNIYNTTIAFYIRSGVESIKYGFGVFMEYPSTAVALHASYVLFKTVLKYAWVGSTTLVNFVISTSHVSLCVHYVAWLLYFVWWVVRPVLSYRKIKGEVKEVENYPIDNPLFAKLPMLRKEVDIHYTNCPSWWQMFKTVVCAIPFYGLIVGTVIVCLSLRGQIPWGWLVTSAKNWYLDHSLSHDYELFVREYESNLRKKVDPPKSQEQIDQDIVHREQLIQQQRDVAHPPKSQDQIDQEIVHREQLVQQQRDIAHPPETQQQIDEKTVRREHVAQVVRQEFNSDTDQIKQVELARLQAREMLFNQEMHQALEKERVLAETRHAEQCNVERLVEKERARAKARQIVGHESQLDMSKQVQFEQGQLYPNLTPQLLKKSGFPVAATPQAPESLVCSPSAPPMEPESNPSPPSAPSALPARPVNPFKKLILEARGYIISDLEYEKIMDKLDARSYNRYRDLIGREFDNTSAEVMAEGYDYFKSRDNAVRWYDENAREAQPGYKRLEQALDSGEIRLRDVDWKACDAEAKFTFIVTTMCNRAERLMKARQKRDKQLQADREQQELEKDQRQAELDRQEIDYQERQMRKQNRRVFTQQDIKDKIDVPWDQLVQEDEDYSEPESRFKPNELIKAQQEVRALRATVATLKAQVLQGHMKTVTQPEALASSVTDSTPVSGPISKRVIKRRKRQESRQQPNKVVKPESYHADCPPYYMFPTITINNTTNNVTTEICRVDCFPSGFMIVKHAWLEWKDHPLFFMVRGEKVLLPLTDVKVEDCGEDLVFVYAPIPGAKCLKEEYFASPVKGPCAIFLKNATNGMFGQSQSNIDNIANGQVVHGLSTAVGDCGQPILWFDVKTNQTKIVAIHNRNCGGTIPILRPEFFRTFKDCAQQKTTATASTGKFFADPSSAPHQKSSGTHRRTSSSSH
jgi:hypothetical protein